MFFLEQKRAYEMRISYWSSDVGSSDLLDAGVVDQRAAVAVRDRDRLGREVDGVEGRAVAAVRDVDQHPDRVHRLDDPRAEVAHAAVDAVGRPRSDAILRIVCELGAALADLVEGLDVSGAQEIDRKSTRLNSSH